MGSDYRWPHVEQLGFLCLRPTSIIAPAGDRILLHLRDAQRLLNYSVKECHSEFEREFGAYWSQRAAPVTEKPLVISLVKTGGPARLIFFFLMLRVRG